MIKSRRMGWAGLMARMRRKKECIWDISWETKGKNY
jgi:hypothetical protein